MRNRSSKIKREDISKQLDSVFVSFPKGITNNPTNDYESTKRNADYNETISKITPKFCCYKNVFYAFIYGGLICMFSEILVSVFMYVGLEKKQSSISAMLSLILLSVVLTGLQIYGKLEKKAGAGLLVPITGFANGICAPAIEYKCEGEVFGVGCKIFCIAGPVILYGILTSFLMGILYYIGVI